MYLYPCAPYLRTRIYIFFGAMLGIKLVILVDSHELNLSDYLYSYSFNFILFNNSNNRTHKCILVLVTTTYWLEVNA